MDQRNQSLVYGYRHTMLLAERDNSAIYIVDLAGPTILNINAETRLVSGRTIWACDLAENFMRLFGI